MYDMLLYDLAILKNGDMLNRHFESWLNSWLNQGKSMFTFGVGFSFRAIEIFGPASLFELKSVRHPSEVVALAPSNHSC